MNIPSLNGFGTFFNSFCPVSSAFLSRIIPFVSVYSQHSLTQYLNELSREELFILDAQHSINMASIDNERATVLLDIASRRYVDEVERATRALLREEKSFSALSQSQIMDAKIAALEADLAQLETVRKQVQLAIDQQELRVKELDAKIKIQLVEQAFVEAEISQKNLDVEKAKLEEARVYQRIIEYQIQVVETGIELQRVPTDVAQLRADRAEYLVRGAQIDAQVLELEAQITNIQSEIDGLVAKAKSFDADKIDFEYREQYIATHIQELRSTAESIQSQIRASDAKKKEIESQIASVSARVATTLAKTGEMKYEISKVDSDAANLDAQAEQHLLSSTTVEETLALVSKTEAELNSWPDRISAINNRITYLNTERDYYSGRILSAAQQLMDAKRAYSLSRHDIDRTRLWAEVDLTGSHAQAQVASASLRASVIKSEADLESVVSGHHVDKIQKTTAAKVQIDEAIIASQEQIAKANVTSKVMHIIGGA